jgi:hypothetical protein
MSPFLDLPMKAVGKAVGVARAGLQLAEAAAEIALERVRGGGERSSAGAPPAPPRTPPAPPPPPAPAAPAPRRARRPAPASPASAAPEPAPIEVVPEPTRGQAARIRAEKRAAEQTADSPGPEIRISEPWPGYASMKAPDIVDSLATADDAVKAIVLLYESGHRKRKTVLKAAGGE